ncbi:MAG TPA: extracellular solute-binding protein [Firmicutes bacterium]|nr:extracellular solute-binding protein [Bacillota bacterium]
MCKELRRLVPLAFLATTVSISLAGPAPVAHGAKTIITHYHNTWHGSPWRSYLAEMEKAYEKAHPDVDIRVVDVPGHEYLTKVTSTVAAGIGPDVLEAYPDSAAPYLERGLIRMLDDLVARDGVDLGQFIPQVVEDFKWKGQLWSLPISTYPILTIYNSAYVEEAGLIEPFVLKEKWDWSKVIEYGRKLTIDRNDDGTPERWGIKAYWSLNRWFIFVHQAGGSFYDRPVDPTESRFNTPPVLKTLEWMRDLYFTYRVSPFEVLDLAQETLALSLSDGPTIFRDPRILKGNRVRLSLAVAPMPMGPANNGTALFANGFQIAYGSRNEAATWEWLKFITLDPANVLRFVELTGRPPARVELLPKYAELLPQGVKNGAVFAPISLYPHNVPDIVTPFTYEIEQAVNPLMLQVLRGEIAPAAAQEKMHAAVSTILKKRGTKSR